MEKYPKKRAYAIGKLYKFLKEKGVYKQFVGYVKIENEIRRFELRGLKNINDLRGAFTWANTQEGSQFWYKLAKELDEQT